MMASLDRADAIAEARAHLAERGVVHIRQRVSSARFLDFARQLGTVWSELRVFVEPSSRRFVMSPRPVPFHTDSVRANLCAWHCVTPCRTPVTNLYLDARVAFAHLDADDQRLAERLRCADLMDDLPPAARPLVPVVEPRGAAPSRFFWLPPQLQVPTDPRERAVAARLIERFRGDDPAALVGVELGAGEVVIVDNHRMLHGRGALPPDSPRELHRLWINTDGWPEAVARDARPQPP